MSARAGHASFLQRLERRSGDARLAVCVGVDPAPEALALLGSPGPWTGRDGRVTRAAAIERFAGLVIESARDHAAAIKPQVAWFEAAGAPGIRALERVVAFARGAGLLVVLDAKRGDVAHSARGYAQAWLGADASSGVPGDALTVHASVGADALTAMASVAAERSCALYALLHTSNPGAATLQGAELADGRPWWQLLADECAQVDASVGGGVVGAVVGATRPAVLEQARDRLPNAALLVPGIGAQGGTVEDLRALAARAPEAPPTLVAASRSLLPDAPVDTAGFRAHVARAVAVLRADLDRASSPLGIALVE